MKGIIFMGWKVKYIGNLKPGGLVLTRRVEAGLKEINQCPDAWYLVAAFDDNTLFRFGSNKYDKDIMVKPRYRVGETVYVKEVHYLYGYWLDMGISLLTGNHEWVFIEYEKMGVYFPDNLPSDIKPMKGHSHKEGWYKRSPLFLPAWAARYHVVVEDARPEKLQDITNEDAILEGIEPPEHAFVMIGSCVDAAISPKEEFAEVWNEINSKRGYGWDKNPWVIRYALRK